MSYSPWSASLIPDLKEKTILITGGNSGLGLESAKILSRKGARVIITARNPEKGKQALQEILQQVPGSRVQVMVLDLADFDSIRAFSKTFHQEVNRLDILINNAGVMNPPKREQTRQGFELQWGTNHLGHFLLTGLLLDLLRKTPGARIAVHSSIVHKLKVFRPDIHWDDLNREKSYDPLQAYSQSKLANLMFAYELDRRLKKHGIPVVVAAAHPGYTTTNLQRSSGFFVKSIVNHLVGQSVRIGALPIVRAAAESNLRGGEFFGPGGWYEMRGYPVSVPPSEKAANPELARKLWTVSEELTGFSYGLG